ncbi:H-type lectin domain-containing protein [Biomphalaria pfeifferi]|uniref:H-type lectin domain-containing protein n=1 Tax=Biomphalaria pfeifferi TaxID=112525 RepID=A0AAD8AUS0_BIOPF|nr:H-type lectin domain-containing protein [Biomphalaria pfeifferi]
MTGRFGLVLLGLAIIHAFVQLSSASNDTEKIPSYETSTYIHDEWRRPEYDQNVCTTKPLDDYREEVTCITQVKFKQSKLDKLLKKVENMENKLNQLDSKYDESQRDIEGLNTEVRDLKNRVTGLESNLTATVSTVKAQEKVLNDLRQSLASTTSNVNAVRSNLASIRTEEGTVYCSSSNEFRLTPSEGVYNRVKYVRVNFRSPFTKVPQVWGSIRAVDADRNTNFRYNFQIRDISTLGFTVVCQTWADTLLHGIDYQWRATTPIN